MANKNNKSTKTQKKNAAPAAKTAPKAPEAPKAKDPVVETPEVEEVQVIHNDEANTIEKMLSSKGHGLSMDGQVRLLDLASRRFVEAPNAAEKYGIEVVNAMDRITAVGIVAAFADEAVTGNSTFSVLLKKNCYPVLAAAAKSMGIELPDMKLLGAPVDENGKPIDDVVALPSSKINVSEETKEQVKEEKKTEEAGNSGQIELDPKKVAHMSEEDLTKALNFILITNLKKHKSPKNALVEAVDFMQAYRLELAEQAENAGEAKEKIAERSMYSILTDVFGYVKPSIHLKGIGIGMHQLMCNEKSPLSAFLILRKSMTDKGQTTPCWDDQSIADSTRALIELICNERLKTANNLLAELDEKDKDYESKKTAYEAEIKENTAVLKDLENVSFDIIAEKSEVTSKALARVWEQYYPECDAAERPRYKGLESNLEQRAGIILNMFREPGNKNQLYDEANLVEITKITMEEYLKEQAEAKKAESKNA